MMGRSVEPQQRETERGPMMAESWNEDLADAYRASLTLRVVIGSLADALTLRGVIGCGRIVVGGGGDRWMARGFKFAFV